MRTKTDAYECRTEPRDGRWQFTVYRNGNIAIRRGSYATEPLAREAAARLLAHKDAPRVVVLSSSEKWQ